MKKKFLNFSLSLIKKKYPDTSDTKLDELRYGLEGFYLTITKFIFTFVLAYITHVLLEMFLLLLFFNILRTTGFGLHASKSSNCLISSSIVFIFIPLLAKFIVISFIMKIILGIVSIILIFIYSPADTKKRPIVNKKRRELYKMITTINCIILVFLSLIVNNEVISNLIIFGIYIEITLILPFIYMLLGLSYNNFKNYAT